MVDWGARYHQMMFVMCPPPKRWTHKMTNLMINRQGSLEFQYNKMMKWIPKKQNQYTTNTLTAQFLTNISVQVQNSKKKTKRSLRNWCQNYQLCLTCNKGFKKILWVFICRTSSKDTNCWKNLTEWDSKKMKACKTSTMSTIRKKTGVSKYLASNKLLLPLRPLTESLNLIFVLE